MKPLIDIRNMVKLYNNGGKNEVRALNGISLTVHAGEFVAIIGQSGSGKSTLMNMLGCLDTPTSGEYFLDGESVSEMNDNHLSMIRNLQIGFIFQGFNLIPSMSALENVELPLIYRGVPKEERRALCLDALKQVGLSERASHKPPEMSGGQQQRVAIARAVAARPPIILADEPTGNLDTKSGAEIMEILHALHREGKTILLISHDRDIAGEAERIIWIQDGVIVEDRVRMAVSNGVIA